MQKLSSEQLLQEIRDVTTPGHIKYRISRRELSRTVEYSHTTLIQWLNRKYPHDPALLESALRSWLSARELTPRDVRKSRYILELLNSADDKEALLQALIQNRTT